MLARTRFSRSAGSSTTTFSSGVTLNSVFPLLVDHMRQQLRGKGNVQRDFTPAYNHCTPRVASPTNAILRKYAIVTRPFLRERRAARGPRGAERRRSRHAIRSCKRCAVRETRRRHPRPALVWGVVSATRASDLTGTCFGRLPPEGWIGPLDLTVIAANAGRNSDVGSQFSPANISSKWTCGPRLSPLLPTSAITSPTSTRSPATTCSAELCAYIVMRPPG